MNLFRRKRERLRDTIVQFHKDAVKMTSSSKPDHFAESDALLAAASPSTDDNSAQASSSSVVTPGGDANNECAEAGTIAASNCATSDAVVAEATPAEVVAELETSVKHLHQSQVLAAEAAQISSVSYDVSFSVSVPVSCAESSSQVQKQYGTFNFC